MTCSSRHRRLCCCCRCGVETELELIFASPSHSSDTEVYKPWSLRSFICRQFQCIQVEFPNHYDSIHSRTKQLPRFLGFGAQPGHTGKIFLWDWRDRPASTSNCKFLQFLCRKGVCRGELDFLTAANSSEQHVTHRNEPYCTRLCQFSLVLFDGGSGELSGRSEPLKNL